MQREPVFNVPASVVGALAVLAGVHLVLWLQPSREAGWWTYALALIPARYAGHADDLPGGTLSAATSFLTHMLVHADATHLGFNCAWLLAFGGAIARRIGGARFLVFALGTGIAGALVFLAANSGEAVPMVGASGAISGLMGGVFRFLFNADGHDGLWRLRNEPWTIPIMPLSQTLSDRRVLLSIAVWIGVNFLALLGLGGVTPSGGIAWEAHIGGFLAGLLSFGAFERNQLAGNGAGR